MRQRVASLALVPAFVFMATACGGRSPGQVAKCLQGKGLIPTTGAFNVPKELSPGVPNDLGLPRRVSWVSVLSGANEVLATNEAVIFFTDNVGVPTELRLFPGRIKTQLPPLPENIEDTDYDRLHLQVVWYQHPDRDQTKVIEGCLR
jgi:hypothetical protein